MHKGFVRFLVLAITLPVICITTGCEWNRTFGGDGADTAQCIRATSDGGFIVAGSMTISGDTNAWVMKVNAFGKLQWQKTFGGIGYDCAYAVEQTSDGGYIAVGETAADNADVWAIRLTKTGETVWEKTFGGSLADRAACVSITPDDGYIIGATTASSGNGMNDAWVIRLMSTGEVSWQTTVGAAGDEIIKALQIVSDGGVIAAGGTTSITGTQDVLIIKIDQEGQLLWWKAYQGGADDIAAGIVETSDSGYLIAANREMSPGQDIWLIKIDGYGTLDWEKTIGLSPEDTVSAIARMKDGGFILTGSVNTDGLQRDMYLLRLDASGTYQWDKTFGGTADDTAHALCLAPMGGFALAGSTGSFGAGQNDAWLIKTTQSGKAPSTPQ